MTDAPPALSPQVERQIQALAELTEAGLQAARAVGRAAEAEGADVAAIALAYARVSRALRLTIQLQTELMKPPEPPKTVAETEGGALSPEHLRKVRVERIVQRLAMAEHPGDENRVDALMDEAAERLDDEDLYGDLMQRPLSELVARICTDVGLDPDWRGLAKEFWAQEEMAGGEPGAPLTPYLPREAVGGGPLAEERGVEGAGLTHDVFSHPLRNSS